MQKKKGPKPNLMYEHQIHHQGYRFILGMDEAGRGAWAGPVTVGAVCLPLEQAKLSKILTDVRDSKVMTPRQRERTVEHIKATAIAWGVGHASNTEIDTIGIVAATKLAMNNALIWPEKAGEYPQITIVDGDARSLTIAAASIIAKTTRDQLMRELDTELPHYAFGTHKGYGTGGHAAAIKTFGVSPLHRLSFAPVRKAMAGS
jgi:ribonuclease HII